MPPLQKRDDAGNRFARFGDNGAVFGSHYYVQMPDVKLELRHKFKAAEGFQTSGLERPLETPEEGQILTLRSAALRGH